MGADKALVDFHGRPLAAHVAAIVAGAAGSATLVGSRERYAHLGPVVEDAVPGQGPLGGIAAALGTSGARWNLIVACDLPFLTSDFLAFLLTMAHREASQAVVPAVDGCRHPLCAVFDRACRGVVEEVLAAGERKFGALLAALRVREITPAEWKPFDARGLLFHNVNTGTDLERATAEE